MLINATQPEELRVAMVDGQKLYDLDIEVPSREQKKSNIYKGKITRVEPSLEAAFVDYGAERHGFLPLKEIARSLFGPEALKSGGRVSVKDAVHEGQEVVVQVDKEERGTKGAALTTFVSLAGRYLVLMPNNPRAGGVSRRIEGEERNMVRDAMAALDIPEGMGLIVRTAGVGRSAEELQWDLNYLLHLWESIEKASAERSAPFLIYQESNVIIRALRDYLRNDIGEILIDDASVYGQARDFLQAVVPQNLNKLKQYDDPIPLFSRFQIETQIESAFQRQVTLPSGGAIVIDHTEALTSIDINSARATKGSDIEETARNTNLEAADEIARQLRIRDLGGLIVIDFIDMAPTRNQREVENRLREALKMDRARVQVGRISRFGLLEMSRQRLRPSLGESSQIVCPRCTGHGFIRGVESLALSVLRIVEEEAMKDRTARVVARLPVEVGTYLLNEKRNTLHALEDRYGVALTLVPTASMETPHYDIQRVRTDELEGENAAVSYQMAPPQAEAEPQSAAASQASLDEPAVKVLVPPTPAPVPTQPAPPSPQAQAPATRPETGFIKRMWATLFGRREDETASGTETEKTTDQNAAATRDSSRQAPGRSAQQPPRRGEPRRGNDSRRGGNDSRRGNDNRRGNDTRRSRGPRPQDKDKPAASEPKARTGGKPSEKPARPQGARSEARAEDKPRGPEAAADTGASGEDSNGKRNSQSRSRRGRRGGRRRSANRSGDGSTAGAGNSQQEGDASSPEAKAADKHSGNGAAGDNRERGQRRPRNKPAAQEEASAKASGASVPALAHDGGEAAATSTGSGTGGTDSQPKPRTPAPAGADAEGASPEKSAGAESPRHKSGDDSGQSQATAPAAAGSEAAPPGRQPGRRSGTPPRPAGEDTPTRASSPAGERPAASPPPAPAEGPSSDPAPATPSSAEESGRRERPSAAPGEPSKSDTDSAPPGAASGSTGTGKAGETAGGPTEPGPDRDREDRARDGDARPHRSAVETDGE